MILRIEDTDQQRTVEHSDHRIQQVLQTCGIEIDEGGSGNAQYVQSYRTRQGIYKRYADALIDKGYAYRCFCSKERLDRARALQSKQGIHPIYDKLCLGLGEKEIARKLDNGEAFTVRMNVVQNQVIKVADQVRGGVQFDSSLIDDQIIVKSDGFPTYHLASVVDDHLMEISHVIRGEEWLSSLPKHYLLYDFFKWPIPKFYHLPLLVNKDRQKLSKRHGDVSVEHFLNQGYEPMALINFVALLGWSPAVDGGEFIPSMGELIERFDISKVQKGAAAVDEQRLRWLNTSHLRNALDSNPLDILQSLKPVLIERYGDGFSDEYLVQVLKISHDRAVFRKDLLDPAHISFYFIDPIISDDNLSLFDSDRIHLINRVALALSKVTAVEFQSPEHLKHLVSEIYTSAGLSQKQLLLPLRVLLTGKPTGSSVYQIMSLLGKSVVLRRLDSINVKESGSSAGPAAQN
jgi:glutamyl-tRNA synthetase